MIKEQYEMNSELVGKIFRIGIVTLNKLLSHNNDITISKRQYLSDVIISINQHSVITLNGSDVHNIVNQK